MPALNTNVENDTLIFSLAEKEILPNKHSTGQIFSCIILRMPLVNDCAEQLYKYASFMEACISFWKFYQILAILSNRYKEFIIRISFREQKRLCVHRINLLLALYLRQNVIKAAH